MNKNKTVFQLMTVLMIVFIAALMTACKTDDAARAENEEKLLKAMTEYPGEGLYDPVVTVIGIGADEPSEEDRAEAEKKAAEEREAWQKAVGDCFADGMFDTFYGKWDRTHVISAAWAYGLTTTMTGFSIEDDSQDTDNIEHAVITVTAVDEKGTAKTFDMDWQIIVDKDDTKLIQKISLVDDGGFWDAYQLQE